MRNTGLLLLLQIYQTLAYYECNLENYRLVATVPHISR